MVFQGIFFITFSGNYLQYITKSKPKVKAIKTEYLVFNKLNMRENIYLQHKDEMHTTLNDDTTVKPKQIANKRRKKKKKKNNLPK